LINWPALAIIAWHRGELASAERLGRTATLAWHRSLDLMGAADGVEFLGVLAAGRERFSDAARLLTIFGREPVDVCVPFTILALLAASHARASMDNVMWAYQARQVRTW
jgi:hypothetical protein